MTDTPYTDAPASVTYSVVTNNGYPILFTLREVSGTALMVKMLDVEKAFADKGFKPQERSYGPKQAKPVEYANYACPICGEKVVKKTTKTGKIIEECSTRKYDPTTQTTLGCSYFKWV